MHCQFDSASKFMYNMKNIVIVVFLLLLGFFFEVL